MYYLLSVDDVNYGTEYCVLVLLCCLFVAEDDGCMMLDDAVQISCLCAYSILLYVCKWWLHVYHRQEHRKEFFRAQYFNLGCRNSVYYII
jgi:hypothetical protein